MPKDRLGTIPKVTVERDIVCHHRASACTIKWRSRACPQVYAQNSNRTAGRVFPGMVTHLSHVCAVLGRTPIDSAKSTRLTPSFLRCALVKSSHSDRPDRTIANSTLLGKNWNEASASRSSTQPAAHSCVLDYRLLLSKVFGLDPSHSRISYCRQPTLRTPMRTGDGNSPLVIISYSVDLETPHNCDTSGSFIRR